MTISKIEHEAVRIASIPGFDIPHWWLTFYLAALPERLERLSAELAQIGAVNLEDADGGFLYPKVRVANAPTAISSLITQVVRMAAMNKVDVLHVDADTSEDVTTSRFEEIIRYS
jgi:hypothetical protein